VEAIKEVHNKIPGEKSKVLKMKTERVYTIFRERVFFYRNLTLYVTWNGLLNDDWLGSNWYYMN
jgi:hypothetical protein